MKHTLMTIFNIPIAKNIKKTTVKKLVVFSGEDGRRSITGTGNHQECTRVNAQEIWVKGQTLLWTFI